MSSEYAFKSGELSSENVLRTENDDFASLDDHGGRGRSENDHGRRKRSETITAAAGVATSNPSPF
jgi:hypothetical protein